MKSSLPAVVQHLRQLARPPADELTDRQLLRHFAIARDEQAFAALVQRHGRMVLGVCRRVLRQEQDAEDAFQATFLLLARKARAVRWHDSVGGWLYRVARRVASAARDRVARRQGHEQCSGRSPEVAMPDSAASELGTLLDEEQDRLPERYRAPLLLCYLEGATRDQAASQLGLSLRTLDRRLQHGREALRSRLARRGFTLSAVLLAAALTDRATAALPPGLISATVRAAAGDTGIASTTAAALAEGLRRSASLAKLRLAGLVLLALAAVGFGAGMLLHTPVSPAPNHIAEEVRFDVHGDPLPPGALARLGTVRWHHGGSLSHVGFAANGRELLTAGPDGLVRVWHVASGKELRRLGGGPDVARRAIAVTSDGSRAAVAEPDGVVRIWDVSAGKELLRLPSGHPGGPIALAFSADGKCLASRGLDQNVILWDVASGKELQRFDGVGAAGPPSTPGGGGESLVFAPNGRVLAVSFADLHLPEGVGFLLWNITTGKEILRVADRHRASGREPREKPVTFSPDGKSLARIVPGGAVVLHDTTSGQELRSLAPARPDNVADQVAFSPDGKRLATLTGIETAALYDVQTGERIRELNLGPPGRRRLHRDVDGRRIAFSPNGKLLASVWADNTVRLHDVETGLARPLLAGHTGAVVAAIPLDGNSVLTFGDDGTLRRWRADTGQEADHRPIPGEPAPFTVADQEPFALTPDGQTVALVKDYALGVWSVATGKELRRWTPDGRPPAAAGLFFSLRLSPGGQLLAALDYDHRIHVRDVAAGTELPPLAEDLPPDARPRRLREVTDYAFAPDGQTLATVMVAMSKDWERTPAGTLSLWDVATGRRRWQWTGDEGPGVAVFAPDGRSIALATARQVILWETASGKERSRLPATNGVPAFSPDGGLLAVAEGAAVRVWDVGSGKEVGRLTGHDGRILGLSFSPDGRVLLTASADSTALIWDAQRLRRRVGAPASERGR